MPTLRWHPMSVTTVLGEVDPRFLEMLEDGPLGVFVVARDGTMQYVNSTIARVAGFPDAASMVGSNIRDFYRDPSERDELWRRVDEHGAISAFPVTLQARDGQPRHLLLSAMLDGDALRGVSVDATATTANHDALQLSLELNRRIVEALPGGVVHVRSDGSIATANADACRVLGLSLDKLTQRYTVDFVTETVDEDGVPCPLEDYPVTRALATGEAQPPRIIGVRRPAGDIAWALFRAVPVKDPKSGEVTGAIVTFLDITSRRRAEEALRESEARYRELVEGSPDPMATVQERKLVFINRAGVRLLGAETSAALLGKPVEEIVGTHRLDALVEYTRRRHAGELLAAVEAKVRRLDGGEVDVDLSAVPYVWRGQPATLFTARDISQRRRAEARYHALVEQMRHTQKLESLGLLAGGVAHDFNNLLAAILGNTTLASRHIPPGSEAAEALAAIEVAARRAADITGQMLTYSGRGHVEARALALSEVVREMAGLLGTVVSKRAELISDLDDSIPLIEGDAAQLQQIVMNLILNASDALGERPGVVSVKTGVRELAQAQLSETYVNDELPGGQYVFVEVSDTGHGMDAPTLSRVFDPFFTTKTKGRGLGLAATLGIVRRHGGAIQVESEVGAGTTFSVFFPASSAAVAVSTTARSSVQPTGGATVLVVDDETIVREVTCRLLEAFGYRAIPADGGSEALRLYAELRPNIDVVLLDMTMADMGGGEVFERLVAEYPGVRVILCSGYFEEDLSVELGSGAAAFLHKPYAANDLVAAIEAAVSNR